MIGVRFFSFLSAAFFICLIFVLLSPATALDFEDESDGEVSAQVSISGLIMNQARSVPGNEFYRIFSSYWYPPEIEKEYNIFIRDRVHPHLGTWAIIVVNDLVVHRVRLNNRNWEIEQVAKSAIDVVERYVVINFSNRAMQRFDQDLVGDGL